MSQRGRSRASPAAVWAAAMARRRRSDQVWRARGTPRSRTRGWTSAISVVDPLAVVRVVPLDPGVGDDLAVRLGDEDVGRRVAALEVAVQVPHRPEVERLDLAVGEAGRPVGLGHAGQVGIDAAERAEGDPRVVGGGGQVPQPDLDDHVNPLASACRSAWRTARLARRPTGRSG